MYPTQRIIHVVIAWIKAHFENRLLLHVQQKLFGINFRFEKLNSETGIDHQHNPHLNQSMEAQDIIKINDK